MKWSIIRVGIVTLFMGLVTNVLGMTDDDREQRRAERHQRKLQQYKSGWNRTRTCNMPVRWDCSPLAWVGITGERNSGKRRSCSA